ncbi:MAG: hypothetical protein J6A33_02260 [Alphaproteobacteria bacterium]|nr:hypothetical protein [Alphaproteobacteria bacterium]
MNNFLKICFAVGFVTIFCSCSTPNEPKNMDIQVDELFFAQDPEPVKGKLDVYSSMARAVKYNIDVTAQNMNKKIFNDNPNMQPREVIRKVLNVKTGKENPLYDGLRALDFSIVYAVSRLSDNRAYVDAAIYAKSAQNLALAAIKSHKDALFAQKKVKEIDRLMARENKILAELNKKLERAGSLAKEELAYKKGLEVSLLKLSEMRNALLFNEADYARLVKADERKMELEGRKFYEIDDFDEKLDVQTFQRSAYYNRSEFALSKELNKSYSFQEVEANLLKAYPELERLQINGYNAEDPIYAEELERRANKVSVDLVDAVMAYQASTKAEEKKLLKSKAFDALTIAVFTQVELAFDLVKAADYDEEVITKNIHSLRKEIKNLEKRYRLNAEQKIELLNLKVALLSAELKESQILAEQALAIRSLYFYAGFSPFNKTLLRARVKDIATTLKLGFNQDVVEMLAAVPEEQKKEERIENKWAKQDDWLEKLMTEKKPGKKVIDLPSKPMTNFDLYEGEEFNKKKIMQLGSYRQAENANVEWAMLKELYPQFREYNPVIEKTKVNKKTMYRLVIRSADGGFRDICNKLRRDRVECILR